MTSLCDLLKEALEDLSAAGNWCKIFILFALYDGRSCLRYSFPASPSRTYKRKGDLILVLNSTCMNPNHMSNEKQKPIKLHKRKKILITKENMLNQHNVTTFNPTDMLLLIEKHHFSHTLTSITYKKPTTEGICIHSTQAPSLSLFIYTHTNK